MQKQNRSSGISIAFVIVLETKLYLSEINLYLSEDDRQIYFKKE